MLLGGAELFVRGASKLAASIGVSSLVIGLTVVSFGTSAPELAIGIQSGLEGESDLLIGNVVGSNIFNVLLVLGASAVVTPLVVDRKLIRLDVPLMIGASILLWIFSGNGSINMLESGILTSLLVAYLVFTIYQGRREPAASGTEPHPAGEPDGFRGHWLFQIILIVVGLALLVAGARMLVASAVEIAGSMGVSSAIIGLTIVSAGTSLPEVATSLMASLKGERDIAVGNVVGSNLFNILGIMGISGLVIPGVIEVPLSVLALDIPLMTVVAVACMPIFFTGYAIDRWEGGVFIGYYIVYIGYLVLNTQGHDLLPLYNQVVLWFALPLTVLTLGVIVYRQLRGRGTPN